MATPRTRAIARAVVEAEMPHGWEDAFQVALESCGANVDMTSIFKWYHEGSKRYYMVLPNGWREKATGGLPQKNQATCRHLDGMKFHVGLPLALF